jgi:hypothetical protein
MIVVCDSKFSIFSMARRLSLTRLARLRVMESTKRKISQVDGTAGSVDKENKKKLTTSPARQSSLLSMWGPKSTTDKDKAVSSLAVSKAPTMSKSEFEKELTEEQKKLLKLEIDTLNSEWLRILKPELTKPSFLKVSVTRRFGMPGLFRLSNSLVNISAQIIFTSREKPRNEDFPAW